MRVSTAERIKHATLINDNEVPRLAVHGRRGSHGGTQQFLHLVFLHGTPIVGTYAGARGNVVEHSLFFCHLLLGVGNTRHQPHAKHHYGYGEHEIEN